MSLAKAAMLVSVNVVNGGLLGERRDDQASALVTNTYQTADRRTKASKYLIDRQHKSVKRVIAASQRVREVVYKYTFPWGDDKVRGLTVKLADEFKVKLDTAIAERQEAIEDYIFNFPALVAASERELGPLFDRSQYPDTSRVRDLFKLKVTYWPMPESGHFVADVSAETAKTAKADIEREIEERLIDATYDMVKRAKEVVAAFVDKLESFEVKEETDPKRKAKHGNLKSDTIFRDSLVSNIQTTANLVERMNVTGNAQIKKVVKDLMRLVAMADVDHIRKPFNKDYREKALSAGQEILINLTMLDLKDQEVSDMVDGTSDYMDM